MEPIVVLAGAANADAVPGIEKLPATVQVRYVSEPSDVAGAVIGADVAFGWGFASQLTKAVWHAGDALRWVHWCGSGIDSLIDDDLVSSEVILTNSRGTVSRGMAEFTLALILAFAKKLPDTLRFQTQHQWTHQLNEQVVGANALVIGVGSIGREIGRVLSAVGLNVDGMGRHRRESDEDFRKIYGVDELDSRLPYYDYVVLILPSTSNTAHLFGAKQFGLMKPTARLINLARGTIVDESALIDALERGDIAGAGLDVFQSEPLPAQSPLWDMKNVIVSPHISGEYEGYDAVVADLFVENVRRYMADEPLLNVIDKKVGFFSSD